MDRKTREFVRQRASHRCEYCGLLTSVSENLFHIEHIRARQHGGDDSLDNLALACRFCNSKKGTNASAYDPLTGNLVALFHPRRDDWGLHFKAENGWVSGQTPVGRATVALLEMNRDLVVRLRQLMSTPNDES